MSTVLCEKCGTEYGIGDWPHCPHGRPTLQVDAFSPRYDEMLSTDGLTYTSGRERTKYMDANAIVEKKNPYECKIARGSTGQLMFVDMGKH